MHIKKLITTWKFTKGLVNLYFLLVALIIVSIWFIYRKQWQNLIRPMTYRAEFSGSPHYIAGSTSGSPLSELGSHCGFKAVPEKKAAASSALFATVASFGAGRIYDFAFFLYGEDSQVFFRSPESRKVHFRPYCIEERIEDRGLQLYTRLFFLKQNVAVLDLEWVGSETVGRVRPTFLLQPTGGRDLENPYPHFNGISVFRKRGDGLLLAKLHRLPGLKLHAFFLPSSGACDGGGRKELHGPWMELKPGEKKHWSVIISFSADGVDQAMQQAGQAHRELASLVAGAKKRWSRFEEQLPVPDTAGDERSVKTLRLAAWALENSLYAPRGNMLRFGSVPAKVYFPFFWGWDTPQHVLGLSEWNPKMAGDVLLTQLQVNSLTSPARASYKLKIKGITILSSAQTNQIPSKINDSLRGVLNLYGQPPLQSWAALRTYQRLQGSEERKGFLREVLPPLRENIRWWEENRLLKNGFFSYINGLESGLDDSPRFYPRTFLPSFIVGLIPRFLSAVDLNCWLFQSYTNLSYLSREAGQETDAEIYLSRAIALKEIIDEKLWSVDDEAWLDLRNGRFIGVITPVIWWPAFLGASACLEKIRTVIERYILNPHKFWGKHGIPSVSFDDVTYNVRKDGYYWRGQIWMINNYSALEVLFRFGYAKEAAELHDRVIQTLYRSEGLYETYNADTGAVGWSSRGPGDPAVMQFGMSAAWATQILLHRYQNFCHIFPHTEQLSGHIQWATTFDDLPVTSPPGAGAGPEKAVLQVQVPGSDDFAVPHLFIKSCDGKPLLESSLLKIRVDDPAGSIGANGEVIFSWRGESHTLQPGIEFLLRPAALSDKLVRA